MKEKYIVEKFPRWYIDGTDRFGLCDITDGNGDVLNHVAMDHARRVIAMHNAVVDALVAAIGDDEASGERLQRAVTASLDAR